MVGSREKIVDGAQHGFTREITFVVFTGHIIYLEIKRYKFL